MPRLIFSTALLLTACSSTNPLFGLDPTDGSGETTAAAATGDATTTATPTSQGPTTAEPTSDATSDATSTASPSEPVTSGTSLPGTTTGVDPNTTEQTTSDDQTSGTSTGEMLCELYKDPDFHDLLHVGGQPLAKCSNEVTYFHGKIQAGGGELRFNTSNTGCNSEENYGVLSLGAGYELTVANESKCAKLYLYRDGVGPDCDIAQFFIIQADNNQAIAVGAFSPTKPVQNPPPTLLVPEPELLPCCPAESQGCCDQGMFGDHALHVDEVTVLPGATEDVKVDGQSGRLINIQSWQASECLDEKIVGRRDFVGIRL